MPESDPKAVRWIYVHLCWFLFLVLAGFMLAYRSLQGTLVMELLAFDRVPLIEFLETRYADLFWLAAAFGGALVLLLVLERGRLLRRSGGLVLLSAAPVSVGLVLFTCRHGLEIDQTVVRVHGTGVLDWILLVVLIATAAAFTWAAGPGPASAPTAGRRLGLGGRVASVFLLVVGVAMAFALVDHLRFWSPGHNGGYRFARFFAPGEIGQANLVLFSTSALFSALAAGLCALAYLGLSVLDRVGLRTPAVLSAGAAMAWAGALILPWQVKIIDEIRAEGGWMLPVGLTVFLFAGLWPWIHGRLLRLRAEASAAAPGLSEGAFLAGWLVPVQWALPRRLFGRGLRWIYLVAFAQLALLVWLLHSATLAYEMDDWRSMIRAAEFPFLRLFLALWAAGLVYFGLRRALAGRSPVGKRQWILAAAAGLVIIGASWPFWGWGVISKNTFARTAEFSYRHKFELSVLYWLFDGDGDGYAAVLHGGDPDDGDPGILPGGLPPFSEQEVVPDRFARRDPDGESGADAAPHSLLILFLEGVTPRAISAYGLRDLPDGLVATPNLDALAAAGTRFTAARAAFPCTWDAWFAVSTGRFLRPLEMSDIQPFRDRYSPYNNLYRVLEGLLGFTRFCQASAGTYTEMLLDAAGRAKNFEDDFDPAPSAEERTAGVTRGDRRIARMLRFIDSVSPGERFFMVEHMSDTHFPWHRTSDARARELGFPHGLAPYEQDAWVLVDGEKYLLPMLARYFNSITRMDAQVGAVIDRLKARGLYDRTTIIVIGDHGCQFYEHEHAYYVSQLYEQSLRIPLIVRVPGLPGGQVSDAPVLQVDILPTILDLAGLVQANRNEAGPLPGRSLLPVLRGEADASRLAAMRDRDLVMYTHYDTLGVLTGFRNKLIFDRPTGTVLLFDLQADPGEMHNLADARPELLDEMFAALRRLSKRYAAFLGGVKRRDGD